MAFRTNKMPILQSKTASGAVATFNTALAMPLPSCNIAVNAWQEGSGDPSPDNVRPIHGWTASNVTRCGKNLFDYNSITIDNITFQTASGDMTRNGFFYHLPSGTFTISARGTAQAFVYMNIESSEGIFKDQLRLSTNNPVWITKTFTLTDGDYIVIYAAGNGTALNISSNDFMIEVGSTATDYEPYVTPTIYTKALGETVYGGSYNSVTGVKTKDKNYVVLNGSENIVNSESSSGKYRIKITGVMPDVKKIGGGNYNPNFISNMYKSETPNRVSTGNQGITIQQNTTDLYIYDRNYDYAGSAADYATWLENNNLQIVYPIAEPIETDIGSTPISTNIGNNTIFADTGDVDLTFKDLDIAKRGNFREVFKLPS